MLSQPFLFFPQQAVEEARHEGSKAARVINSLLSWSRGGGKLSVDAWLLMSFSSSDEGLKAAEDLRPIPEVLRGRRKAMELLEAAESFDPVHRTRETRWMKAH